MENDFNIGDMVILKTQFAGIAGFKFLITSFYKDGLPTENKSDWALLFDSNGKNHYPFPVPTSLLQLYVKNNRMGSVGSSD